MTLYETLFDKLKNEEKSNFIRLLREMNSNIERYLKEVNDHRVKMYIVKTKNQIEAILLNIRIKTAQNIMRIEESPQFLKLIQENKKTLIY